MSLFQNRAPRLDLSFPLQFCSDAELVNGHCLNLSETGLLGCFNQPLELWTTGQVQLSVGPHTLTLGARVARTMEAEAGLAFCFRGEAERYKVKQLLAFAGATGVVSRPPF